jgi:putative endonuclease
MGEIDIIARQGTTLVFCEVKTRADDSQVSPEEQVNNTKQHQVTKAAKFYLTRYGVPQPPARFDVIAIVWPPGRQPQVNHIENAFGLRSNSTSGINRHPERSEGSLRSHDKDEEILRSTSG